MHTTTIFIIQLYFVNELNVLKLVWHHFHDICRRHRALLCVIVAEIT